MEMALFAYNRSAGFIRSRKAVCVNSLCSPFTPSKIMAEFFRELQNNRNQQQQIDLQGILLLLCKTVLLNSAAYANVFNSYPEGDFEQVGVGSVSCCFRTRAPSSISFPDSCGSLCSVIFSCERKFNFQKSKIDVAELFEF